MLRGGLKVITKVNVKDNAIERAKQFFLLAFSGHARRNKVALKLVHRALKLAAQRGYQNAEAFIFYFRNPGLHTSNMTQRWLLGFFEYVSADEFCQLVNI